MALAVGLSVFVWLTPGAGAGQGPPPASRLALDPPLGWLGITIQDVGEELAERLAERFGPAAGVGVLVVDILRGGSAASSELRRGDVIVRLNAQPIWEVRQLQREVRNAPVGRPVTLTVLRERERLQLSMSVGPMPEEALAAVLGDALGFGVRGGLEAGGRGAAPRAAGEGQVVVASVDPQSPARAAGLRPLDVLVEVDGRPVTGLRDLYRALRAIAEKPAFPVAVRRDGTRVVLTFVRGPQRPSR